MELKKKCLVECGDKIWETKKRKWPHRESATLTIVTFFFLSGSLPRFFVHSSKALLPRLFLCERAISPIAKISRVTRGKLIKTFPPANSVNNGQRVPGQIKFFANRKTCFVIRLFVQRFNRFVLIFPFHAPL